MQKVAITDTKFEKRVLAITTKEAAMSLLATEYARMDEIAAILLSCPNLLILFDQQLFDRYIANNHCVSEEHFAGLEDIYSRFRLDQEIWFDDALKSVFSKHDCSNLMGNPYNKIYPDFTFLLLRIGATESDAVLALKMIRTDIRFLDGDQPNAIGQDLINYINNRFPLVVLYQRNFTIENLKTAIMNCFLYTYEFVGYNPTKEYATTKRGHEPYKRGSLPWLIIIASFLGLPCRPTHIVDGSPQLSFSNLLTNLFLRWNPSRAYGWKIIPQVMAMFIVNLLILPLTILIAALSIPMNIVKSGTEFLTNVATAFLMAAIWDSIQFSSSIYDKGKWGSFSFLGIPLVVLGAVALTLPAATFILALVGAALTSPAKFFRDAVHFGDKKFGRIGAVLFGVLGMSLPIALWAIALPLLVTAALPLLAGLAQIPAIAVVIAWATHLSWVVAAVAWVAHLQVAIVSLSVVSSSLAALSIALSTVFGPIVTALAGIFGLSVTPTLFVLCSAVGALGTPLAIGSSIAVDSINNELVHWRVRRACLAGTYSGFEDNFGSDRVELSPATGIAKTTDLAAVWASVDDYDSDDDLSPSPGVLQTVESALSDFWAALKSLVSTEGSEKKNFDEGWLRSDKYLFDEQRPLSTANQDEERDEYSNDF